VAFLEPRWPPLTTSGRIHVSLKTPYVLREPLKLKLILLHLPLNVGEGTSSMLLPFQTWYAGKI
jgi:hypothetical protein